MNHLTGQQIEALAFAGASLKLEANRYTASQLQSIAFIVKNKGNTLTLTKTNSLSSHQFRLPLQKYLREFHPISQKKQKELI